MRTDPALDAFLDETRALNAKVLPAIAAETIDLSTPEGVAAARSLAGSAFASEPPPDVGAADRTVRSRAGAVDVRIIAPAAPRGVYLDIHGGGFFMGAAAMGDRRNKALCDKLGLAVVSVEYRLAPEYPYPVPVDDCEAAALWLIEHGQAEFGTDRFFMGGASAGATLALAVALRLRDRHGAAQHVRALNLFYGVFDMRGTPSARRRGAPWLAAYLPGRTADALCEPDISPLYADLRGLSPALISVGTLDPLLDDSLFLAARLDAAGGTVELEVYPESVHGFDAFPTQMAAASRRRVYEFLSGA